MQKISTFLWFDGQAETAARFYAGLFPDSRIGDITRYDAAGAKATGCPEGSVMTVDFQLAGQHFTGLNGGPAFKFTPSISFFVSCATEAEIDALWARLVEGGEVLMPFEAYPFSPKFGWLNDRYGVSWQLNLAPLAQKIAPCLMFVGGVAGKAREAIEFYTGLFPDSRVDSIDNYAAGEGDKPEYIKHALFELAGQAFMAMDSGLMHDFNFNEAVSFSVNCTTQAELDRYWDQLSAVPESEQCGWLKDKFGVSWQIVPEAMGQLLGDPDPAKAGRVMSAMLQMKKLDIAALQKAYAGA